MPDDLDRLFERLVRVLADEAPGRLAVPFPAAEVYERLVPYRSNRSSLKVATHQDYEMAVLRLLAGGGGVGSPPAAGGRGGAGGGGGGEEKWERTPPDSRHRQNSYCPFFFVKKK